MRVLFDLAVVTAVAVALLWGCGFLLARLVPRSYRPLLPLLAPFLGFALISAVGHYASAAGLSLRSVLGLFVALAAAGWAAVALDRRLRRFPRSSAPGLSVCLCAFVLAVVPLLSLGYLTTIGTTLDGISYAVRSEYLQDATFRLPEIAAGKPYLGWVRGQIELLRAGDVMLVGVLGLLTRRRSFELLSVVPALFFALTAGSVFVWARVSLRLRRRGALLAAVLTATSNLLLWPVYDNFLSQAIAIGLLPLVLSAGAEGERRRGFRTAALFGLLFGALVSVYPVYAIDALGMVLCFWGVTWVWRPGRPGAPRAPALSRAALWWAGAAAATLLWNGVAVLRSVNEVRLVSKLLAAGGVEQVGTGDILTFPPVVEVLGLIAHLSAVAADKPLHDLPPRLAAALGVGFCVLAAYGVWRLDRRARLAAPAMLLAGAVFAAQQRWGINPPHGYPYGWFKAISALTPLVLALLAAGITAVWRLPRWRWLAAGAALLLLVCNVKNTRWTVNSVIASHVIVDRELIRAAEAAAATEPGAWILLDLSPGLRQHWLGYLIHDRKIRYREPLFVINVETPESATAFFNYALVQKDLDFRRRGAQGEPWYDPARYSRLWGGSRYELRARRDAALASLPWERTLPQAAGLEIRFSRESRLLQARLGAESREVGLGPGTPRTVALHLFSLSDAGRLSVSGKDPVPLPTGGWLVDLDLGCLGEERLVVAEAAGEVLLADVQVLGVATGPPGTCVERSATPAGVAYVEQVPEGNRVRFRTVVLRPENAGERIYRLGIHVVEPEKQKLFGVWSLDFAPGDRLQRGSLEIDLGDRSSRAEINGRPRTPVTGSFDVAAGSFEGDAVWWQLTPLQQLLVEPMLWFRRTDDGKVAVTKTVPAARITVIPSP